MHTEITNDRSPLAKEIAFLRGILDSHGVSDNGRELLTITLSVLQDIQPHLATMSSAAAE